MQFVDEYAYEAFSSVAPQRIPMMDLVLNTHTRSNFNLETRDVALFDAARAEARAQWTPPVDTTS